MKKSETLKFNSTPKQIASCLMKPFADSFVMMNPMRRAKKNCVNLNYYNEKPNIGDVLSPVVVNYMLFREGLSLEKRTGSTKHLYAVGSVITSGLQDCTIWGSGVLHSTLGYRLKNRRLDIRAVRGPISRMVLMEYGYEVPRVYGDPAILLPLIYQPKPVKKTHKYGLIVHINGNSILEKAGAYLGDEAKYIDVQTTDYIDFIDSIMSVDYVLSSSLHGIILAESYGVPAVLVKPNYSLLKYYDWYLSTGRNDFPVIENIVELRHMTFPDLPDLDSLRIGLENSFPYDLFD